MNPFKIDSPTCISFSGGRTSAYMLWRVLEANGGLPGEALVCFANTGKEEEATLEFVRDCGRHWNVDIKWVEYRNDEAGFALVDFDSASRNGEPFEALVSKKRYLPNPVARFCTSDLKVTPIKKHAGHLIGEHDVMVGVRADEQRRVPKLRARGLSIPLVDACVRQEDVQSFWRKQKFDLSLTFRDGVTALGNCDLCFLKGSAQVLSLIRDEPERAVWWAKMEERVGASFRSDRPSYKQMMDFAETQGDMFGQETIPCFCGE